MFAEKLGDDGRLVWNFDASAATQNPLRQLQNSNGLQDKRNISDFKDLESSFHLKNENKEVNNDEEENHQVPKDFSGENSESLARGQTGIGFIRSDDEGGTRTIKNKSWTNKVDGISNRTKTIPNGDEEELTQQSESNVRAFFSNLLKYSLRRIYNTEENVNSEEDEESNEEELKKESMGNLQTGEKKSGNKDVGKSPSREKKKAGFLSKKSPGKDARVVVSTKGPAPPPPIPKPKEETKVEVNNEPERVGEYLDIRIDEDLKVVPPEGIVGAEDSTVTGPNGNTNSVELDPAEQTDANMISDAKFISTDSWRQVQKFEINRDQLSLNFNALSPQSRESSSESIFTDPLTPRALAEMEPKPENRPIESGSSSASKTSTISQKHDPDFEDTSSLDDVTLIDEQLTDTEADDSTSASFVHQEKCRSASLDILEENISIASSPCQRPTSFTLHKHKKVELGPITSKYFNDIFKSTFSLVIL